MRAVTFEVSTSVDTIQETITLDPNGNLKSEDLVVVDGTCTATVSESKFAASGECGNAMLQSDYVYVTIDTKTISTESSNAYAYNAATEHKQDCAYRRQWENCHL